MTTREVKRPFAVFDIDGTLIRWQLYHAICDQLAREGQIDQTSFAKVKAARMIWKKRASQNSFSDYEKMLVRVYETAITNISVKDLMRAVETVFDEYKDQTYAYTRDLIRKLKNDGYLLFAISASQVEIIELLANYYGFDDYGGSVYEQKNGKFTGQKHILKSDQKPIYLNALVSKHNSTLTDSIGLGDSEGDVPMLSGVANPIAFNPNRLLFEHAKRRGWPIVIERKNMIYELKPKNGSYCLRLNDA